MIHRNNPKHEIFRFDIQSEMATETEFKTLLLTEAPVLTQPTCGKEYVIFSDASLNGLGCVLMQGGKVVAYASR